MKKNIYSRAGLFFALALLLALLPVSGALAAGITYAGDKALLQTVSTPGYYPFDSIQNNCLFPGTQAKPEAMNNEVVIDYVPNAKNKDISNAFGGFTMGSEVSSGNTIILNNGKVDRLYGGYSLLGDARDNVVRVHGGTVTELICGGVSASKQDVIGNYIYLSGKPNLSSCTISGAYTVDGSRMNANFLAATDFTGSVRAVINCIAVILDNANFVIGSGKTAGEISSGTMITFKSKSTISFNLNSSTELSFYGTTDFTGWEVTGLSKPLTEEQKKSGKLALTIPAKTTVTVAYAGAGSAGESSAPKENNAYATAKIAVKAEPNAKSKTLGTLKKNEAVNVTGVTGAYVSVEWQGATGYIPITSVSTSVTDYHIQATLASTTTMYSTSNTNKKYAKGTLEKGAKLDVLAFNGAWACLQADDQKVYVQMKYLQLKQD